MIRVAIVEDHTMVRQTLARLIAAEEDLEVVAEAGSAEEALPRLRGTEPDVVLLDITLPGADGLSLGARMRQELPGIRIVFLSMHGDETTLRRATRLGTDGFVAKTAPVEEVVEAIRTVGAGGSYISRELAGKMLRLAGGQPSTPAGRLTERELEVLRLLAAGVRPGDIAERLVLSLKTVKNHLTAIYTKLGVETAAQAVAESYRLHIVNADALADV